MEEKKRKKKNETNSILRKTWERCRSFGNLQHSNTNMVKKSKSWSNLVGGDEYGSNKKTIPTHGCFSVYVGPDKQRFVMKVECTKHPLFKKLLQEAEMEYGYHCDGPLVIPCDVNSFVKVMDHFTLTTNHHSYY